MWVVPQIDWGSKLNKNEKWSEQRDCCSVSSLWIHVKSYLKVFLPRLPTTTQRTFKLRVESNPASFSCFLSRIFLTEMRKVTKTNSNQICCASDCWNRDVVQWVTWTPSKGNDLNFICGAHKKKTKTVGKTKWWYRKNKEEAEMF